MDRRQFLTRFAAALKAALVVPSLRAWPLQSTGTTEIHIKIDSRNAMGLIPADFVGLGYEISSVAIDGLLAASNRHYVNLVRTLGTSGVIRIGGNTSDYASFAPQGREGSTPKGTVLNQSSLRRFGAFLHETGWKLIWGLNLGGRSGQNAVEEAVAVSAICGDKLLAFEIGNEPDLFFHEGHRQNAYLYDAYLAEYRNFKAAIRGRLPNAPFAGPDAAGATNWVTRFAEDEGHDLKLLTHHYYREGAKSNSTMETLLGRDPKLEPMLDKLRLASTTSHVPYRICEVNSFYGGGKPGISDRFAAALWVLDYMCMLAWAGAAGVNLETGINQLGFVSSYSPIADNQRGTYSATPEYYGMLAFSQVASGQKIMAAYDPAGLNLAAYACMPARNRIALTVINKDEHQDAVVELQSNRNFHKADVMRLAAPWLESFDRVTLGGAAVDAAGRWRPTEVEAVNVKNSKCNLKVPAGSAAIMRMYA